MLFIQYPLTIYDVSGTVPDAGDTLVSTQVTAFLKSYFLVGILFSGEKRQIINNEKKFCILRSAMKLKTLKYVYYTVQQLNLLYFRLSGQGRSKASQANCAKVPRQEPVW